MLRNAAVTMCARSSPRPIYAYLGDLLVVPAPPPPPPRKREQLDWVVLVKHGTLYLTAAFVATGMVVTLLLMILHILRA